jgi:hypothetical protein
MTTTEQAIEAVLSESRNGMNYAIKAGLYPMLMSDGAKELCEAAGCYWLMDILGTEAAPKLKASINAGDCGTAIVSIKVKDSQATIEVTVSDDAPTYWGKHVPYTDFPEGEWTLFEMGPADWDADGRVVKMICALITEH